MLTQPETTHREFAISEIEGEIMLLKSGVERQHLTRTAKSYLLFDVENDPNEIHNLAGKPEVADVETALRLQILEMACADATE